MKDRQISFRQIFMRAEDQRKLGVRAQRDEAKRFGLIFGVGKRIDIASGSNTDAFVAGQHSGQSLNAGDILHNIELSIFP